MLRISGKRGSGKTLEILKLAAENNGVMLVPTMMEIDRVRSIMKMEGIPYERVQLYTSRMWFNLPEDQRSGRIYMDDLDLCFKSIIPNLQAYSMTTGKESVPERKLNGRKYYNYALTIKLDSNTKRNQLIDICMLNGIYQIPEETSRDATLYFHNRIEAVKFELKLIKNSFKVSLKRI